MLAMIQHHSIAILTSERAELSDQRVCGLTVGCIKVQRREVDEVDWLAAETTEAAEARPTPEFEGVSDRSCG